MAEAQRPKHFSMLRSFRLAALFTSGNAGAGTAAIFLCLDYIASGYARSLWPAFALLFTALLSDILDGTIARWRQEHSLLGADLDSLADSVSFGVAPAVL